MSSKLRPLFARVVIQREELQNKTSIIIPDEFKKLNAPSEGVVIAKGPTADDSVVVGDKVIFGRHAGDWFKDPDGNEVYICQDEDVIAVVEP